MRDGPVAIGSVLGLDSTHEAKVTPHDMVCQAYAEDRPVIFAYLRSLGAGPADAQELTQEVFLSYYVALRRGSQIAVRRAWLFTVASRLFLNLRRQQGAALVPFDDAREESLTISDRRQTPEDDVIKNERLQTLAEAIGTLSPQQQICLHLRAEGLRYHEIAEVLGVKVPTVSEFIRRALARLRRILDA
jgi:RNA polymerase sigma-70 factor (ECF subfamily)